MRHQRGLLVALAFLGLAAATPDMTPTSQAEGKALLHEAVTALLNDSADRQGVTDLLARARAAFAGIKDQAAAGYWLARVDYADGILARGAGQAREARGLFEASVRKVDGSLGLRETSDAWRLKADDYAQLMLVDGPLSAVAIAWRIRAYAEKAIALDPANAKAQLTLALYALNAPSFAGGSIEAALAALRRLRERTDLEEEDSFAVRVWLAVASAKAKDSTSARTALAEAQSLYPGNSWARDIAKGLE